MKCPLCADDNRQSPRANRARLSSFGAPVVKRGVNMIKVSRLHGKEFYVNPDMIEFVEETPDLVVSMISGKKIIVEGSAEELLARIVDYRIRTNGALPKIVRRGVTENEVDLEPMPGMD